MRKIISLICLLLPALALATQSENGVEIRGDAPDQHVVVKGDTLWDISGKFFKDPWKWPRIWGINKDTIKDPHWIYPGNIIFLDRSTGTLRIGDASRTIKLSPQIRDGNSSHDAIPSIPAKMIEPFLSQPLVIEEGSLTGAPTLVALQEGRVIAAIGDSAYAKGLSGSAGDKWQVYRPGKTFTDPQSHEVLGREAIYLGDVEVTKLDDISSTKVTRIKQEINLGDRLIQPSSELPNNYLPRVPDTKFDARVISSYGGVSQAGQNTVVTLNKGKREGIQSGHVLALYSHGQQTKFEGKSITLPDERYGLVFVFRVFEKVSYALVMQTKLPVQLLDKASTP
jgi:hypothetical protein